MLHPKHWVKVKSKGLYCMPGGFFIDPFLPVDFAIITHGHGDHARSGHQRVIATPETLAIMKIRYGERFAREIIPLSYHTPLSINDVTVTLIPAGHILGSAQILIEHQFTRLVISGDYKRSADPTCLPFVVTPCDVFVTEATFALPIFRHPPIQTEISRLLKSLQDFPQRCHLVGAYALGKCQRVIAELRLAGYQETIYLHGAMLKLCSLYQQSMNLGTLKPVSAENAATLAGKIVICPPSALHDRWSRKLPDVLIAHASGWMRIRARARQKSVELPLVISDHGDWSELVQTLHEVAAPEIWVTHGREEALIYYAEKNGFKAKALALIGYEEQHQE
jgi:putative mRNA 3-end processing factor